MKILRNGKSNIIKDLEEQFNENIYLVPTKSAYFFLLQHGTKNKVDDPLEVGQETHVLLNNTLLKDEMLIITKNDIIKFKDKLIMY
jgi:hypothetical protein